MAARAVSCCRAKYGMLTSDWREDIRQGFAECFRVLVGNYLKKNGLRTTVVADGRQMRAISGQEVDGGMITPPAP